MHVFVTHSSFAVYGLLSYFIFRPHPKNFQPWSSRNRFPQKCKLSSHRNSAVPQLGVCPRGVTANVCINICSQMLIAAILIIARIWKQPKDAAVDEQISKMRTICTLEHYLGTKIEGGEAWEGRVSTFRARSANVTIPRSGISARQAWQGPSPCAPSRGRDGVSGASCLAGLAESASSWVSRRPCRS